MSLNVTTFETSLDIIYAFCGADSRQDKCIHICVKVSQLYVPEWIQRDYPGIYRPRKRMVLNTLHSYNKPASAHVGFYHPCSNAGLKSQRFSASVPGNENLIAHYTV